MAETRAANGRTGLLDLLDENPLKVGAATLALGFIAGLAVASADQQASKRTAASKGTAKRSRKAAR